MDIATPAFRHTSLWCSPYLSKRYMFMAWYLVKHRELYLYLLLYLAGRGREFLLLTTAYRPALGTGCKAVGA